MIAALVATAAAGTTWWVPDPGAREALTAAIATEWPELDVEVVVGAPPPDARGYTWDAVTVTGHTGDLVRRAGAPDARVAVLHARTWSIETADFTAPAWLPTPLPLEAAAPVARWEPRKPGRHWSVGVGVGSRTMTTVPEVVSGVRMPIEVVAKSLLVGLDVTADPDRFLVRNVDVGGLTRTTPDAASSTLRLGLRSQEQTWLSVSAGLQYRVAAPTLSRGGRILSTYERPLGAAQAEFGVGHDLGFVRFGARSWLRITPSLPVSAGLDLDVLTFFHERRVHRREG